jgi:signal transduction histidine kinase
MTPSRLTAQESAAAEEVIQKTREAAEYLAREKAAGVDTFKTMKSQFVWRDDGYVFVFDCDHGMMLANPAFPRNNGISLANVRDHSGVVVGDWLCKYSKRVGGGWFSATPKPGQFKGLGKLIFVRSVPGTTYQVGSGIYSETADLADLEKLSRVP